MVASNTADKRYVSKDDYLNDVFKNGAVTNASTYYAGLWYYADCDVAEWQRLVGLYRLALENPLLTQETLAAEIGNASGEMKRNINTYSRLAGELAKKKLNLATLTSEEHVASFKDVTLERVREHYGRTHTRANMQFIVTGDVKDRQGEVVAAFSNWSLPRGKYVESESLQVKTGGSMTYKYIEKLPSVYLELILDVPRYLTPAENQTFQVINAYLFNVLNAEVLAEARHKGLAYELHGLLDREIAGHSLWRIWAPIPSENVAAVLDLIFAYVKAFTIGRTKQYGQTVADLTELYSRSFSVNHSVSSYEDVDVMFKEVTPALARRLVREFVESNRWVLSGVGAVDEAVFKEFYDKCDAFFKGI
jgi:predicted Zn-dependent peptidase